MTVRRGIAAIVGATALLAAAGCADTGGRDASGAYVDDDAITTTVKARLVEDKTVDVLGWRERDRALEVLRDDRLAWEREIAGDSE